MGLLDHRGARTPACRVHTRVNALMLVRQPCVSQESEHGTHECLRHGAGYLCFNLLHAVSAPDGSKAAFPS